MGAELFDVPRSQDKQMTSQREQIHPLDLDGCGIVYIHKRMNEFELKQGGVAHRFDTWPDHVRIDIQREIDGWIARNPNAAIKAITMGVNDGACTLALHWRPK
ncbi:hypothetical protein IP86_03095 [Rhodopseudomonas sp. AAP120]|uniref:hypothetical protein n=1 Tax=Rhodopseudomonas sp. AAP120 TaxID=1523430 RepID=UPI0006B9E494|nr:hypothetical protein [Rhodopseudomonas sp. AAP120]KPG01809.1 hypothetical protein IP86_03095 [Rhodopseudomonas sp. AAP120]